MFNFQRKKREDNMKISLIARDIQIIARKIYFIFWVHLSNFFKDFPCPPFLLLPTVTALLTELF